MSGSRLSYAGMADQLPPNVPRTLKHYRMIRRLGAGGMGAVFEAEDRRDQSRVAVKLLHPHLAEDTAFRERFEREAHVAALLRSPYTVHLLDYGQAEGHFFLVMEYIDGPSVANLIEAQPLRPLRALAIASEVGRALEEAEARGVVHRDIKPENILIAAEDSVKVADFGIARRVGGGGQTEVGGFVGSILYASPEQARGEADRRSDIYALGAVLYAMLAGHPPFNGAPYEVMRQHAEASLPVGPLQGLPDAVVNIVRRCLEKDPQDRYQSASELAGALERAQRYVLSVESGSMRTNPAGTGASTFPPATTGTEPPATVVASPKSAPDAQETATPAGADPPRPEVEPVASRSPEDATVVAPAKLAPSPPAETVAAAAVRQNAADAMESARSTVVGASGGSTAVSVPAAARLRADDTPAPHANRTPGKRRRVALAGLAAAGVAVVLVLAVVAVRLWPASDAPTDLIGADLVKQLDDQAVDAFQAFGSTTARVSRPSSTAAAQGAIDSVRITSTSEGITRVVQLIVFPSVSDARRYANDLLQQAGISGGSGCTTGTALPDAPTSSESSVCYLREGAVVVIASVAPPAGEADAEALAARSSEVVASVRKGETPRRATVFVATKPSTTTTAAATTVATTSPAPTSTPAPVPTATQRPSPTVVPAPISAGVWTYDFGVTRNTCSFGLPVGSRYPSAYRLAEVAGFDGLISPGELVDVTQDDTGFYIGRLAFTFPTFVLTFPVNASGETGTATLTNNYLDANTGTATLTEVYFLLGGGSCSFDSAE